MSLRRIAHGTAIAGIALYGWQVAISQQLRPDLESRAADTVAAEVDQIRSQNNLPKLARINDPHLHEDSCKRAQDGAKSWRKVDGVFVRDGAVTLSHFSYSTEDPTHVEPEFESWARHEMRDARRFAVGVCLVTSSQEPDGRYWIDVISSMGATKSFFYRAGLGVAHLWSK